MQHQFLHLSSLFLALVSRKQECMLPGQQLEAAHLWSHMQCHVVSLHIERFCLVTPVFQRTQNLSIFLLSHGCYVHGFSTTSFAIEGMKRTRCLPTPLGLLLGREVECSVKETSPVQRLALPQGSFESLLTCHRSTGQSTIQLRPRRHLHFRGMRLQHLWLQQLQHHPTFSAQ